MQVLFWPHKPSSSFLDKLEKLVDEEPGINLVIRESGDVPPSSSGTLCMCIVDTSFTYTSV